MADDKKQPEQDSKPAANSSDYREYRELYKTYKRTQEAQEILTKSMQQYAQEGQQTQEVLSDNADFNPETKTITVNNEYRAELDPKSSQFDPVLYNSYAAIIEAQFAETLEQLKEKIDTGTADIMNSDAMRNMLATANEIITPIMDNITKAIQNVVARDKALQDRLKEWLDLQPYLEAELLKPEYEGKALEDLTDEQIEQATEAARAAMQLSDTIAAQNAGRELRRQMRTKAEEQGAIMEIRGGILPVFSERNLWDAFAPGKISRLGTLSPDEIDKRTGKINKAQLELGEVLPLNATEISYKAFMLLNAIMANSVENFREYFVSNGAIEFYVKGVLDTLEIDPRIKDDMQLNLDRKTAGVLYLEKQLEPLLSFIGTTPNGSRYTVLSYDGYNVDADTMTIRTPYLYQLWIATQERYSIRKQAKLQRQEAGKKPLKKDTIPLEVNMLFKNAAYKEDDAVLEIATYITNVMLTAGKGSHKTEISYKTLINNCPRFKERLKEIEMLPKTELLDNGKKRNNTARYNTELRKIARAYSLIMSEDKCDALRCFEFYEFKASQTENGSRGFTAPTKSTLDDKIIIKWKRILND